MSQSGDLLASLQLDDEPEAQAPQATSPEPEPTRAEATDPDTPPAPEADPASTPESLAPDPVPAPPVWTPTGEPFKFKVDHTEVAPEGALQTEHGILFPQAAWDRVRSEYLGNRQVWRQTQEHWQGQLRAKDEQLEKVRLEAQSAIEFVNNLIDTAQKSPDAFVANLDHLINVLPVKRMEAKARLLEEREVQRQQEQAQYQAAQVQEQLENNIQDFLTQKVEAALAGTFKGLTQNEQESAALLRDLYDRHGLELFEGIDPSTAHLAASQGFELLTQVNGKLIGWYPHRFEQILGQRQQQVTQQRSQWQKTAQATQRNQAAMVAAPPAPPKVTRTAPMPSTPRNDQGQFAKASRREVMRSSRALLDNLTLDDD